MSTFPILPLFTWEYFSFYFFLKFSWKLAWIWRFVASKTHYDWKLISFFIYQTTFYFWNLVMFINMFSFTIYMNYLLFFLYLFAIGIIIVIKHFVWRSKCYFCFHFATLTAHYCTFNRMHSMKQALNPSFNHYLTHVWRF
jgi:hypothetical protein